MRKIGHTQSDAYVSSSSQGGGTIRMTDNIVWSRSPPGGNRGEVCSLLLHLVALVTSVSSQYIRF